MEICRGDATVATPQNWKEQKKHLNKLFSGVSFNHELEKPTYTTEFCVVQSEEMQYTRPCGLLEVRCRSTTIRTGLYRQLHEGQKRSRPRTSSCIFSTSPTTVPWHGPFAVSFLELLPICLIFLYYTIFGVHWTSSLIHWVFFFVHFLCY